MILREDKRQINREIKSSEIKTCQTCDGAFKVLSRHYYYAALHMISFDAWTSGYQNMFYATINYFSACETSLYRRVSRKSVKE